MVRSDSPDVVEVVEVHAPAQEEVQEPSQIAVAVSAGMADASSVMESDGDRPDKVTVEEPEAGEAVETSGKM